jgi:hypothetical protein
MRRAAFAFEPDHRFARLPVIAKRQAAAKLSFKLKS